MYDQKEIFQKNILSAQTIQGGSETNPSGLVSYPKRIRVEYKMEQISDTYRIRIGFKADSYEKLFQILQLYTKLTDIY